jgi:hypothetical protein
VAEIIYDRLLNTAYPVVRVQSREQGQAWPPAGVVVVIPHRLGFGGSAALWRQSGLLKKTQPAPPTKKRLAQESAIQRGEVTVVPSSLPSDLEGKSGFVLIVSDAASMVKNAVRASNEIYYRFAESQRIALFNRIPKQDPLYFPMNRPWLSADCITYYIRNAVVSGVRNLIIGLLEDEDHFDRYLDEPRALEPALHTIQRAFDDEVTHGTKCIVRRERTKNINDAMVNLGILSLIERNLALKDYVKSLSENEFNTNWSDQVQQATDNIYKRFVAASHREPTDAEFREITISGLTTYYKTRNSNKIRLGYGKAAELYAGALMRNDPQALGIDQESDPARYEEIMKRRFVIQDDWDLYLFKRFIAASPFDRNRPKIGINEAEEKVNARHQLDKLISFEGGLSQRGDARWHLRIKNATFPEEELRLDTQVGRKRVNTIVGDWIKWLNERGGLGPRGGIVLHRLSEDADEPQDEQDDGDED